MPGVEVLQKLHVVPLVQDATFLQVFTKVAFYWAWFVSVSEFPEGYKKIADGYQWQKYRTDDNSTSPVFQPPFHSVCYQSDDDNIAGAIN